MASQETNEVVAANSEYMKLTAAADQMHLEAYHPGFFERQLNVAKEVSYGAYDRLKDDVINFANHPLRSTAEIAGTAVIGGALVAGAFEAGAATAVYAGVASLSTEIGALFGATAATVMVAPVVEKALDKSVRDWSASSAAREIVADPAGYSAAEVQTARIEVRHTLGSDFGGLLETAGMLAAGAGVSRTVSAITERNVTGAGNGVLGDTFALTPERAFEPSVTTIDGKPQFIHISENNSLVPHDVANQFPRSLKPSGLWFSEDFAWSENMSDSMPEILDGHAFKLDLSGVRLLEIKERADLDGFIARYGSALEPELIDIFMRDRRCLRETVIRINIEIDWNKVAENWDGILFRNVNSRSMRQQITPSSWQDDRPVWFRGLDIDSGVVWNASKVKVQPVTK
jgi:hypothetical protein